MYKSDTRYKYILSKTSVQTGMHIFFGEISKAVILFTIAGSTKAMSERERKMRYKGKLGILDVFPINIFLVSADEHQEYRKRTKRGREKVFIVVFLIVGVLVLPQRQLTLRIGYPVSPFSCCWQ